MEKYFYSYVLAEQEPKSKYQFSFKNYFETTNGNIETKSKNILPFSVSLLDKYFRFNLWKSEIYEIENYLDFHYQEYKGNKNDFLIYTAYIIQLALKEFKSEMERLSVLGFGNGDFFNVMPDREIKAETCYKWIEKKKNEIEVDILPVNKIVLYNSFDLEKNALKSIADVLDILHTGNLVSTEVKVPQFKKGFSGGIVTNKIQWIGSMGALHFFVIEVCKFSKTRNGKWKIAENVFFKDGKELNDLSNNKSISKKDKATIQKAIIKLHTPT